jgi:hypothetical protein
MKSNLLEKRRVVPTVEPAYKDSLRISGLVSILEKFIGNLR